MCTVLLSVGNPAYTATVPRSWPAQKRAKSPGNIFLHLL